MGRPVRESRLRLALTLTLAIVPIGVGVAGAAAAATAVCVEIQEKDWAQRGESPAGDAEAEAWKAAGVAAPEPLAKRQARERGIDPARYLERMVAYEVTHEIGFEAVEGDCQQRLTLELYPYNHGWTVFARYSGTVREEKVDRVQLDEFVALAQRITRALLRDRSIRHTITRENVLRDDSEGHRRKIQGRGHAQIAFGTSARVGPLPTANDPTAPVTDERRLLTPLNLHLGYRGKFQAWALDAFTRINIGTNEISARNNEPGGHADYTGSAAAGLHFLRYTDPEGVTSLYWGGGGQFELALFDLIRPAGDRASADRETLLGGGLNLDLVVGYEFMRASSLQFYIQGELNVPLYRLDTENEAGAVDTYLPGGLVQIGMMF